MNDKDKKNGVTQNSHLRLETELVKLRAHHTAEIALFK